MYTFEGAKTACGNVAGLLLWTIAMTKFYAINKDVLPLKANLTVMQSKYDRAATELQAAEVQFQAKEKELNEANAQLQEAETKKNAVLEDARLCEEKMNAATALIDGLSDEKIRWTEQIAQFASETERLVGDVVILSAFLCYAGPFNQEFRDLSQHDWYNELTRRHMPVSMTINVTNSLTDMATIGSRIIFERIYETFSNNDTSQANGA